MNNSHSLQEKKNNIRRQISNISRQVLFIVCQDTKSCKSSLQAESWHFDSSASFPCNKIHMTAAVLRDMIGGSRCSKSRRVYGLVFINSAEFNCLVWMGHCNFIERLHDFINTRGCCG